MKDLIVLGMGHLGMDVAIYLAEHNIPYITLESFKKDEEKYSDKTLIMVKQDVKLSDVILIIENEMNPQPFIFKALPKFEEPEKLMTIQDVEKPFYDGLYSKGGKKKKKRFGK